MGLRVAEGKIIDSSCCCTSWDIRVYSGAVICTGMQACSSAGHVEMLISNISWVKVKLDQSLIIESD